MGQFGVGQAVRRKEDLRLLTGRGNYLDDMTLPDQAYAHILRSPHAHARIIAIDTSAATAAPGVVAVLTAADLETDGIGDVPCLAPVKSRDGSKMFVPPKPLLASGRVRHVGDAVALIVADSGAAARDAAELIAVDYEALPAVTGTKAAVELGAPAVWDEAPGNVAFDWELGDKAATDKAFSRAAHVAALDLVNQRIVVNSIEPRGVIGEYDPDARQYTVYTPSQHVHMARDIIADMLGTEKDNVRVVAGDVGGGFGMKVFVYPEHGLMPWAAKRVGRPVRWASDRAEAFLSDTQGRDHVTHAELALDGDGKFLAFRVSTLSNLGAYVSNFAPMVATVTGSRLLTGLYEVGTAYVNVKGVHTHTVWVDAYRGAGRPEASYIVERLVDLAAQETGRDPAELRRRNLVPAANIPYEAPLGITYDSGDFVQNLDGSLDQADWAGFEARRKQSEASGRLRGIGIAVYVEAAAGGPNEHCEVLFEDGGTITVLIGTLTNGQGHATSYSQVLEDALGVPFDKINVIQGDTARVATGGGTGGSKSMMLGGAALTDAAEKIIDKGTKIAAHMLEAAEADIDFSKGVFSIVGTDRRLTIAEVASAAKNQAHLPDGIEPGLDTKGASSVEFGTYPNGCHVCEVEIDPDTGTCTLQRYTVVDDFGRVINPLLVEGQVHGGIVQGAGQALLEQCVYDSASGQLVTGSFMDYTMPRADDFPHFSFDTNEILCTTNPMGIKGAGEAGTVGALGAVINAIVDALKGYGVRHVEMPATPERIWQILRDARAA